MVREENATDEEIALDLIEERERGLNKREEIDLAARERKQNAVIVAAVEVTNVDDKCYKLKIAAFSVFVIGTVLIWPTALTNIIPTDIGLMTDLTSLDYCTSFLSFYSVRLCYYEYTLTCLHNLFDFSY